MPNISSKKKDLYLGKCIGDLHHLSDLKSIDSSAQIIVKSLAKVFQDAENLDAQGDEEKAYVMYIKYFNILKQVKAKADYKNKRDYFDKLIGTNNQRTAIERAEKLSESLRERYDLKKAEAVARNLPSLESPSAPTKLTEKKEITEKTETKVEKESQETPVAVEIAKVPTGVITCKDLCELLRDSNTKLILMDVRPTTDFIQSHIPHTECISVPEEILAPGSIVNHIQSKLTEESLKVWLQRKNADHIILFDWTSTLQSAVLKTPLRTLKDALFKYDTNTIKSEPLILEGGYEQWLWYYPSMTTNAHVARPNDSSRFQPPSPTLTLEFDYPDLDESLNTTAASPSNQASSLPPINGETATAGSILAPQFDRKLKPSQSIESMSSSNASTDSGIGSSLNNASLIMNQQGVTNGQSAGSSSSGLYPSVPAGMKFNEVTIKNTNILNEQAANSSKGITLSFKNNLATDFSKSVLRREEREAELRDFQHSRDSAQKENQRRLEDAEKKLRDLEQMKKKEEKDVADLMRMKRKLKEELDEEKRRQEEKNRILAAEEEGRLKALEVARREEEVNKHRLEEVERMRLDRKREEQAKELARVQQEEERKRAEVEERARREKIQEEREEERKREAAELAKKTEEEERERQRRADEERIRKEVADKEILQQQQMELSAQEKTARLDEMRKKEQAEREMKQKEQMEREIKEKVERELKLKEQMERERQKEQAEREMRMKEQLEREKKLKEQMERELQQKELERQKKVAAERKQMEEAAQREKEAAEKLRQIKVTDQQTSKPVPSSTLPPRWEKRLDFTTNRYFYIDHARGSTQWSPPVLPPSASPADMYTARLKEEPSLSSSRSLSRSHSSPDIKKLLEEEEDQTRKAMPSIDRGNKPRFSTEIRVPKQTAYVARKRDLNPIYGNVGPALTGLRNLGNTCYMNSTVQCLNNTSPLITYFLNDFYLNGINRESSQGMHGEVVDDFAVVVKALWSQQYRSITPRDLKNTVGKYNPMFAGYQQQDSQEFLTFLLDGLHEGLNEVRKAPDIPEQNNDNLSDDVAAPLAWNYHKLLHKSIIVELFQGQLKSTVMCKTCKKTSVTFQAFMFLSLPIPATSRCTLKDCIKEFLKPELMTGSSRWKCPSCKVERDSEKKIDIWKLPYILLIGLNRFYSEGMWMQKKTTYVDFPVDDLDLSSNIIGPKLRNSYSLYGISNHYGTMEGGHYTAFCRNPVNKRWYKFDDQDVYDISQSEVKTSAAFVLYYSSIDMPAPHCKPHL